MPYVITTPETKSITQTLRINNAWVDVTSTRTIDHVTIDNVILTMPLNNPTGISIEVSWSIGYMESSVFFPVEQKQTKIDSSTGDSNALFSAMMSKVTSDISHYADFKNALYGLLDTLDMIPNGTVI